MFKLPDLRFLSLENLLIHEKHDPQRALPLVARMRSSELFHNPPIVTSLGDGTNRYMVLDGANRVTALRQLGYPHVIAQVANVDDPGLKLDNWNHVVWEQDGLRFMKSIRRIPGIRLVHEADPTVLPDLFTDCRLVLVQDCRGRLFSAISCSDSLEDRVDGLNRIVLSYNENSRLDRTNVRDLRPLESIYPSLAGLVLFPIFKMQDLLAMAGKGYLLPAGITRFSIAPRALHLNYPMSALASNESLELKNQALQNWIQASLAHKKVRYYSEPTFLFDE